jgi:endoglucanase
VAQWPSGSSIIQPRLEQSTPANKFNQYADSEILGIGGPTDDQFADLWTQLATKYADNAFVMFELMNEPHDIDLTAWVASCQQAVAAIRKAEKVSHTILLPGENFSSAGTFLAGWGAALASVTNPDGSTTNLILDLHKYLDVDNSGDHPDCVMDNVADTFEPVAAWLRTNKRQAMVSETGAGVASPSVRNFSLCSDANINLFSSASRISAPKTQL